tara:strand:- start:814 stop:1437 length:624 start_codon:yes stop_codon:yes gene_type:complete
MRIPLFANNLFSIHIDHNTDELKKDKTFSTSIKYENEHGKQPKEEVSFHVLEKYPQVKNILLNEWNKIAKEVLFYPNDFMISTSWFTKVLKGDESQPHLHKNSFYSGVYYFDDYGKDSSALEFYNPLLPFSDFQLEPTQYNATNSYSWKIKPEKNLLILFPSFIEHKILKNNSDSPRRSLAFNIIPINEYGYADSFMNLGWKGLTVK